MRLIKPEKSKKQTAVNAFSLLPCFCNAGMLASLCAFHTPTNPTDLIIPDMAGSGPAQLM